MRFLEKTLIFAARVYQVTVSPLFGRCCRYTPSCSEYFIGSLRRYGPVKGSLRSAGRVLRCHPFTPGGYDPV